MKEQIISILNDIKEDVDYANCTTLIKEGILASLDIIQLVGSLNDEFDITIPANEIIPQNFDSVDAMVAMVTRLADE
ncbi:MAG: acyl carrier protein [Clostridia bacterium]|nr:acyl carrier protein [Clostridia bacterium]